jgi:hypothetical protein
MKNCFGINNRETHHDPTFRHIKFWQLDALLPVGQTAALMNATEDPFTFNRAATKSALRQKAIPISLL